MMKMTLVVEYDDTVVSARRIVDEMFVHEGIESIQFLGWEE